MAGLLCIALYFLRPEPAHIEVINDTNGELINLYRVVQHHLGLPIYSKSTP
ncbi:hypothetical protein EBME_0649 [bacterium endosymbiont of Mortierella elongata FMR23-6]|nr:hypothetical protein EBME_0649 [bacterium endosymbiont of Mortierella elongata FMR23-6]